uniref:Uds1 domain-containing protein n=2 Tax=Macrostomum lignano TaxID=282301 RepID=A0A1I8H040_9PLAT
MLNASNDSILQRANESLEDLRISFDDQHGRQSRPRQKQQQQPSRRPPAHASSAEELRASGRAWSEGQFHNDHSYRTAAAKLAELVASRDSSVGAAETGGRGGGDRPALARGVQFTPPLSSQFSLAADDRRAAWQNLPAQASKAELVELLESQTAYTRALEIQMQHTDSLIAHAMDLCNQLLLDLDECLQQQQGASVRGSHVGGGLRQTASLQDVTRASVDQFKEELQRVSAMHQTRNERLEAQLKQAKADLAHRDEELDRLKADVRRLMSDNADLATGGLSALPVMIDRSGLPVSSAGGQASLVETLRRERDSLVESVTSLKQKLEESRQREQELYDQLTASIETVEQAKLEESNALLEKRQLSDELIGLRGRLDELLAAQSRRLDEARTGAREQADSELEGLRKRLRESEDELAAAGAKLERLNGEKRSLGQQLEEARSMLRLHETELTRGRDELASAATRAALHRDQAVSELGRVRQQLEQERVDRTGERDRLQSQLAEMRARLSAAEQAVQQGGEERLRLAGRAESLMRELQLARSGAESAGRAARQEAEKAAGRAARRESELLRQLAEQEARHEAAAGEMQRLLDQHAGLAERLRRELRRSADQLAGLQAAACQETAELAAERDQAAERLERCQARLRDAEKQLAGHTKAEAELRDRVRQLAGQQQDQSRGALQLLAGHTALQRERDLLAKEADFLRQQMQAGGSSGNGGDSGAGGGVAMMAAASG